MKSKGCLLNLAWEALELQAFSQSMQGSWVATADNLPKPSPKLFQSPAEQILNSRHSSGQFDSACKRFYIVVAIFVKFEAHEAESWRLAEAKSTPEEKEAVQARLFNRHHYRMPSNISTHSYLISNFQF
jgi:hypothetical protein